MIDRSHLHYYLRPRTLLAALLISAALCLLLPALSLVVFLAGCLSFIGCWLIVVLMLAASWGLLVAGVAVMVAGFVAIQGNNKDGGSLLGAGIAGIAIGGLLGMVLQPFYTPVIGASFTSFFGCRWAAGTILVDVWLSYEIYLRAWIVLAAALATAGLVLLAVAVLSLESGLKYSLLKIGYACPHCHHRGLPLFRCPDPACGQLIGDLWPTVYGVWSARCGSCRRALMRTTDLGGRLRRYEKVCRRSTCQRDQHQAAGEYAAFYLPIVGAVSSGKSNLMITSVMQLEKLFAPNNNLRVEFIDADEEAKYRQCLERLAQGKPLIKTLAGQAPKALNLALSSGGTRSLLYLYDAAGEHYQDATTLSAHEFHGYIDGILFLVDPFAEQSTARALRGATDKNAPADTDAADILGRMLPFWEAKLRVSASHRFSMPLAVVVTKMDASGLETRLSAPFAAEKSYPNFREAANQTRADSPTVRAYLVEIGLGNFVRTLEERFTKVAYFAASALGRSPDTANSTSFAPRRVLEPLIWLAYQTGALSNSGLARVARNLAVFVGRCTRGSEGVAALLGVWAALLATVSGAFVGLAWIFGTGWAVGLAAAALAMFLAWSYYGSLFSNHSP